MIGLAYKFENRTEECGQYIFSMGGGGGSVAITDCNPFVEKEAVLHFSHAKLVAFLDHCVDLSRMKKGIHDLAQNP